MSDLSDADLVARIEEHLTSGGDALFREFQTRYLLTRLELRAPLDRLRLERRLQELACHLQAEHDEHGQALLGFVYAELWGVAIS